MSHHTTATRKEWLAARLDFAVHLANHDKWLDRAPLGRNDEGIWWRHRDQYRKGAKQSSRT